MSSKSKYIVHKTRNFEKKYKRCVKRGFDKNKLKHVVMMLSEGKKLDAKFRDHKLTDNSKYRNVRECHIEPDWLLIYRIESEVLILTLISTGTHSDLF